MNRDNLIKWGILLTFAAACVMALVCAFFSHDPILFVVNIITAGLMGFAYWKTLDLEKMRRPFPKSNYPVPGQSEPEPYMIVSEPPAGPRPRVGILLYKGTLINTQQIATYPEEPWAWPAVLTNEGREFHYTGKHAYWAGLNAMIYEAHIEGSKGNG